MITNLLQEIRDLLSPLGALGEQIAALIEALASLASIEESAKTTAENTKHLNAIDTNTASIEDTIGTILSRLTNLLNKTTSIDENTIAQTATIELIKNYLATMTPDVSRASDFSEQIATNTLEIKNHQESLDTDSTEQIALLRRIVSRLDDIYENMTGGTD